MIQIPREPNSAEPVSSLWGALVSRCLRAMRPMPSDDILPQEGLGGVKFVLTNKARQALAASESFPFQVVQGPTSQAGVMRIGVISDSHCLDATDDSTYELDNSEWGLLTDDQDAPTADGDDNGWIDVTAANLPMGSKLWLQFEFDKNNNLTKVSLEWGSVGKEDGNWPYFPDPCEINDDDKSNPYQQYYRVAIAEVTYIDDPRDGLQLVYDDGFTTLQVTQLLRTNLCLQYGHTADYATYPNVQIQAAIPWPAPATKIDGTADEINDQQNFMTPWVLGAVPPVDPWYPFKVSAEASTTDSQGNTTQQVSVDSNSDFWKDMGNKYAITGLDAPFSVSVGDLIWLHIGIQDKDNIVPDEASIEHGPNAWDGHPCPITYGTDDSTGINYQETYEKIIAEVVAVSDPRDGLIVGDGASAVKILQHLKSSLMCTVWAIDGIACLVPEEMSL